MAGIVSSDRSARGTQRLSAAAHAALYNSAMKKLEADRCIVQYAYRIENFEKAAQMFEDAGDYPGASDMAALCREKAALAREDKKADDYRKARQHEKDAETAGEYAKAAAEFEALPGGFKDAAERAAACRQAGEKLTRARARKRNTSLAAVACLALLIAWGLKSGLLTYVGAVLDGKSGSYATAAEEFASLQGFLNSEDLAQQYAVLAEEDSLRTEISALREASAGGSVTYGAKKWTVLAKNGTQYLLMAAGLTDSSFLYGIPFDTGSAQGWADSTLRAWLNSDALTELFTEDEQAALCEMTWTPSAGDGSSCTDLVRIPDIADTEEYASVFGKLSSAIWLAAPGEGDGTFVYMTNTREVVTYGAPAGSTAFSACPLITVDRALLKERLKEVEAG